MRLTSFLALSTLALVACRSDSNNNTDGNNGGDGSGSNGGSVKIQDVQNDAMAPGTPVTLRGVVVTAIDNFGGKMGDIWVEEPEGGTFSGVHVFGAASTDVAALAVGDTVDVTGAVKDEFALTGSGGDTSGRTVTELKPATSGSLKVTKTGTGTVPAPVAVDALMIGQMADADTQGPLFSAAWEPYEGVLVSVNSVNALGAPKSFGSTGAADAFSFDITGVARVEGNFTDITMSGIQRNTCMNITGVVDYFFDYLVLPRSAADLNTSATGCPMAEATAAVCADGIDNDGNGFSDCNDTGCVVGDSACRAVTTVNALDTATTLPTGGVELDNVYVLAISFSKKNLWVSDTLASGQNKGIYVSYGTVLDSQIVVGSKVNVIGKATDFNNDTMGEAEREVNAYSVTFSAAGGAVAPIAGKTAAQLSADHSYVGSLVTLTNVKLTSVVDAAHFVDQAQQSPTNFFTDDDIFRLTETPPTCFATITGIWSYQVFNNGYALLPTADGTTTGGNCP